MKPDEYFLIKVQDDFSQDFLQRWKTPAGQALENRIRLALTTGAGIPDDLAMLEATFANGTIKLADLRGIDLSDLSVGNVDLTYCCFDGANFAGTKFEGTCLQYSSMANAKFDAAEWNNVQASPISACGASFRSMHIQNSFLMRSDLDDVNFTGSLFEKTAFVGSRFGAAKLSNASYLADVDITQILLSSAWEKKRLTEMAGAIGAPAPVIRIRKPKPLAPEKTELRIMNGNEIAILSVAMGTNNDRVKRFGARRNVSINRAVDMKIVGFGRKKFTRTFLDGVVQEIRSDGVKTEVAVRATIGRKSRMLFVHPDFAVVVGDVVVLSAFEPSEKRHFSHGRRDSTTHWEISRVLGRLPSSG